MNVRNNHTRPRTKDRILLPDLTRRSQPPSFRLYHILKAVSGLVLALIVSGTPVFASGRVLMRFPTLHDDTVVFEAGGNLWRVDRTGGTALRLTTDGGMDLMPRFSPDGKRIAFTGQYDGNTDVYVIPAEGGPAKRLTFHSDVVPDPQLRWGPDNMVVDWTPDGKAIVFLSRRDAFNSWFGRLFQVSPDGGLPTALPLPKGGMLSFDADGGKIAYNRIFRNFRTWKDYYGGLAQDIWIYDFATKEVDRVTDWKGTDTDPMWYQNTLYFASDRGPEERLNLWAYDLQSKTFRQVTHFESFDVDWPSLGDTGIVFQCGGALYVLDLPSEQLHEIDVEVPDDGLRTRPRWVDASRNIDSFDVSPNGKRALFGARGEVFTVPKSHGHIRNLTRTSGAREMDPVWSPDGGWVAYVTDRSGEAEIALRPSDGSGEETVLTHRSKGYLYELVWSPDSKKLVFSDSDHVLWTLNIEDKKVTKVDQDPRNEIHHYAWSPDSLWLAYDKVAENDLRDIYLYNLDSAAATNISSGMSDDYGAVFGSEGKYLYFVSKRHENPVFSESEFNVATLDMDGIYVATLSADESSPFAPRSDEGSPVPSEKDDKGKKSEEAKPQDEKAGGTPPIRVDLKDLVSRVVPLPIPAADIGLLTPSQAGLYYMTVPINTFGKPLDRRNELHYFDMKERKDRVAVSPLKGYALSADGATIVYQQGKGFFLRPSGGSDSATATSLDLSRLQAQIDPVTEWSEIFHQAWRLERDLFFNPDMNGVDWDAVRQRYEKLLPELTCREDLNYVIGEMLGELHNSHTYVGGGDDFHNPSVPTGLLGVDFALDSTSGRYRLKRIYQGDNSREDTRSPLTEPGVDVEQGDYLLAVNGRQLEAPANPYSLFVNTLGGTVTLTVAEDPNGKNRREVTVEPIRSELNLRLRAWIKRNRDMVAESSDGKIGYIYLSDMDEVGMDQFIRQFYPQIRKEGLIIDVRYNGGGFIDQILLERLRRVLVGMTTNREGVPFTIPPGVFNGFMACVVNHYSASDGDIFPFYFKHYGLGPLIGTRTWGGVRGIRGYWPLVDGGYVTIPEESLYDLSSEWIIENHGVDPDVQMDDLPGDVMAGKDAQLDEAVGVLMGKIKAKPRVIPGRPTWPGARAKKKP